MLTGQGSMAASSAQYYVNEWVHNFPKWFGFQLSKQPICMKQCVLMCSVLHGFCMALALQLRLQCFLKPPSSSSSMIFAICIPVKRSYARAPVACIFRSQEKLQRIWGSISWPVFVVEEFRSSLAKSVLSTIAALFVLSTPTNLALQESLWWRHHAFHTNPVDHGSFLVLSRSYICFFINFCKI